jgi:ribokinase
MVEELRAAMRGLVDMLIVNQLEAELLSERGVASVSDAIAAGRALRESLGCSEAVVTLGAAGAVAVTPTAELYQPAFVVPVVDSVGAGDAFAGTLIAMLIKSQAFPLALRAAVAAGAIAVGRPGAFDSLPTPAEIETLLNRV